MTDPTVTRSLRMPAKMARDLDNVSRRYGVSVNSEILRRLRWSFDAEKRDDALLKGAKP